MTKPITRRVFAVALAALLIPDLAMASRRGRVVVRTPRIRFVVHRGYPIVRASALNVIVHPARRVVAVGAPLRFLPVVTFAAVAVPLPARERLVWQDTERIHKDENWVESNFGVDDRGDALFLQVDGRVPLNFADVTFDNGDVQVVDFDEKSHGSGVYRLYDFPGVRNVKTVRIVARARSADATLRLYLNR